MDWKLMPAVWFIYMFSVLDRSNLGNAHQAGIDEGIGLVRNQYNILGTMFYLGYITSMWTVIGWKVFPAHIFAACIICAWATMSSLQATVSNFGGLAAIRFFLGSFEAMYAGVPVYLSFFYPREKLGFRQGIFITGAAIANAYGSALGYAILHIRSYLAPWRILFLIEGLPSMMMAIIAFHVFPDSIRTAKFLTDREKEIGASYVNHGQVAEMEHEKGISFADWKEGLKDWRSFVTGVIFFGCNVSFASLPLFVPSIIAEIGIFSSLQSNGLSAPPYLFAFMVILAINFIADRLRIRGPFVSVFGMIAAVGFMLLAITRNPIARYVGVYLAILIYVSVSLMMSWVSNMHSTESKRSGGWTVFQMLGQCGPLLGTNVFPSSQKPYFTKGSWISTGCCLLVAVVSAGLSYSLWRENKKLDRSLKEGKEGEAEALSRGQKGFRYII
ncbi:major facilitator superfamily domain-containing protein [Coniella lustricola]|uniref:Major facilitator superfamily domain-containing protein n=1 Tax=Coniella lustricola TaxID=2025994 RepID=A0A2T3A8S3_9PEZI|nr:major facilitator superfamily domain-containing protein [Coniella lustricola]